MEINNLPKPNIRTFHYLCLPLLSADITDEDEISVPDFHWELYDNYYNFDRLQLNAAPVGFSKSTGLKIFGVKQLLDRVDRNIIYISSSYDKSVDQFTSIKKILKDKAVQLLYQHKVVKENESEVVIEFPDGLKSRFSAHAAGEDISGTNFEGMRPSLILIDDLEELEQASSQDRTDKLQDWLLTTLKSRLPTVNTGKVRMINTVLTKNSLTYRIIHNKADKDNQQVFQNWKHYVFQALKDGKSIWEDRHPTHALLEEQRIQPVIFAKNYMNAPLDEVVRGAYYQRELDLMVEDGRYGDNPEYAHNPNQLVTTWWDIADNHDLNAIGFGQEKDGVINIFDYYEITGVGTDHIANELFSRPYVYGQHNGPFDLLHKRQQETAVRSKFDMYAHAGINFNIAGKTSVASGRDALRIIFPRIRIHQNKNTEILFRRLSNYRAKDIPDTELTKEIHDINSHGADMMRLMAVSIQFNQSTLFKTQTAIQRQVIR